MHLTLTTQPQLLRFLGSIRPHRLLEGFTADRLGAAIGKKNALVRKTFVGEREVVALQTTTRTFVAEGMASHNCICMCGYNATGPVAWTWGKAQQLTWAFWDTYVSEAWPVVSHDWVSAASGKDPEGVDLVTLGAEFQSSVGQNPFPAGSVTPPSPYPAPLPAPVQPPPPAPPAPVQGPGCLAGRVVSRLLGRRYSD
jgi:hypothetical protein